MMSDRWPALPEHDWDTHPTPIGYIDADDPTQTVHPIDDAVKTFFSDADPSNVKVLSNHPVYKPARTPKDDGVRLDTPDAHRAKALTTITTRSRQALLEAESMRQWMISIGYYKEAVALATEAVGALEAVGKFLEIHEGSE